MSEIVLSAIKRLRNARVTQGGGGGRQDDGLWRAPQCDNRPAALCSVSGNPHACARVRGERGAVGHHGLFTGAEGHSPSHLCVV